MGKRKVGCVCGIDKNKKVKGTKPTGKRGEGRGEGGAKVRTNGE